MKRIEWIDIARGIGMLLIIIGHSLFTYKFSLFNSFIFAVHVPLFFILSGYLFHEKPWKKIFQSGYFNLFLPYGITAIIILLLVCFDKAVSNPITMNFAHNNIAEACKALIYGLGTPTSNGLFHQKFLAVGAVWFLLAMFIGNLIFKLLVLIAGKTRTDETGLFILSLICTYLGFFITPLVVLPWSANSALASQLFYWAGHMLRKHDVVERHNPLLQVIGLALWIAAACTGFFYLNVPSAPHIWLAVLGAVGGCFVIMEVSKWLAEHSTKLVDWLAYYGRFSLVVLCAHLIDLDCLNIGGFIFGRLTYLGVNGILAAACTIIYRILVTVIALWLVPRIPLIRSMFMNRTYPFRFQGIYRK